MWLLHAAVALVFMTAGSLKLISLGDPRMMDTWVMALVRHDSTALGAVAAAEILLGAALLWRVAPPAVIYAVAAVIAGVTVWSVIDPELWARPCGCFGPRERFFDHGGWMMLARNTIVVASLTLAGWSASRRETAS